MKNFIASLSTVALTAAFGATAFAASPDVYVVDFRDDDSAQSQTLDRALAGALPLVSGNVEHVVIDTSTAAKWEKGAHEAFDREIVPLFNQWVGLPGFVAVVDADSKQLLGCVNSTFSSSEIAREVNKMTARVNGNAYMSNASTMSKSTACPAPHNIDPGF